MSGLYDITPHPQQPYDADRAPRLVATGTLSLEGVAHTLPPCWPDSEPLIGLNLVITDRREIFPGINLTVENHPPVQAISLETAAGLIVNMQITAEQMGWGPRLQSMVDQVMGAARDFFREHPDMVSKPVGSVPHDSTTCNCPPAGDTPPCDVCGKVHDTDHDDDGDD